MALPVNLKDTLIVTRFDYRNLVRSAPGVIFLVVFRTALTSSTIRVGSETGAPARWLSPQERSDRETKTVSRL